MTKLEELKAQAYDYLVQLQLWQAKLNEVNEKIAKFKPEEEVKEEAEKEKKK